MVMSKKCQQCGCELEDDALFCVQCGAKQDSVVKCPKCGHVILAIIGAIVVALGLFFAFGGSSKPIQVKSSEIVDDYIRDQSSGDKKYKDKTVQVSGKVKWKGQFNNSQNYSITLESKNNGGKTYQVLVDVPAKRASIVNGLKTGDFVNVKGECVGIVKQKSPTVISVQIKSTKINDQDAD